MFKSIKFISIENAASLDDPSVSTRILDNLFRPCLPTHASSKGWVPVIDEVEDSLIVHAMGAALLRFQFEEKSVPSELAAKELKKRIQSYTERNGTEPDDTTVGEIFSEVHVDLLKKAFPKTQSVPVLIHPSRSFVAVSSLPDKKLKTLIRELAIIFPESEFKAITPPSNSSVLMTNWVLEGKAPGRFDLGTECKLKEKSAKSAARTVQCKNQELTLDEIQSFIRQGMQVTSLGVTWELDESDALRFTIDENLVIKKIKTPSSMKLEIEENESDSIIEHQQSELSVWSRVVADLYEDIIRVFF